MAPPKKKKNTRKETLKKIGLSALLVAGLSVASYFLIIWWLEKRAGFAHYEEFGISLPTDYQIHGIDISHHQSVIKWEAVKEMKVKGIQLGFVFMKASEGYASRDWQFGRNWRKAKEVGMPRGAYHFFLPNKNGKLQADNFIAAVDLEKGDLPPVVDIEETYGVDPVLIRKRLKEWLQVVEAHYGVRPILYTYVDFYANVLGSDFDEYPLWVAHYITMNRPRIDREWLFWQHNESGKVNGILSPVDFDVFSGDSAQFRSLLVP
jgi:lysozyme